MRFATYEHLGVVRSGVVTGEGRVDATTALGKAPGEVVRRSAGTRCAVFGGVVEMEIAGVETIAGEGQGGAGFFVIAEGTAKVTVQGQDRGTLGPGDYFGEIALIDEGARTATVTSETDMTCYAMTFWEFRPIVETDSRIAWKLIQALAHKLRELEAR